MRNEKQITMAPCNYELEYLRYSNYWKWSEKKRKTFEIETTPKEWYIWIPEYLCKSTVNRT